MTSNAPEERERSAGTRRPIAYVTVIASVLLGVSSLLVLGADPLRSALPTSWLVTGAVIIGFALVERFVFHVQYRREAHSFSISEVPAALALVFLSPVAGVTIRVVISLAAVVATSRSRSYKLYFNAGLFACEMAIAYWLLRLIAPPGDDIGAKFLIALAFALGVSTVIGSVIVSVVISLFEGQFISRVANEIKTSAVTTPIITMMAAVSVAPALFQPELVLFALVPIAAAWLILQQFGTLSQHHRDLQALHGFAGAVNRAANLEEVSSLATTEACRLLRAQRAFLQIFDANGAVLHTAEHAESIGSLPDSSFDERWATVLNASQATPCSFHGDGNVVAATTGRNRMIGVPIRDETGLIGLLVFAERFGAVDVFEQAELSRANTLAEQLAPTLRRTLLHSRMEHAALHDALTGEANRLAFENAIRASANRRRSGCNAVVMLDLDRFKEVNDTLGHHVGDRVLVGFTARVKQLVEDGDVLARFGGDEFALLVNRPTLLDVREFANEILRASYVPMKLDELDVVVTSSVGIAEISASNNNNNGNDTAEVLRQADVAMYTAKREHTRIEIYRKEIDRRTPERLALLGSLREVLDREGLEVHYQPKIDLVTSTVIGVEALVRWNHPGRGWVSPVEFIQVAEESGLIKQVTDQVLRTAVKEASRWADAGHNIGVAVNLSTHDLLDERLPERIDELLRRHSLPADKLTLEITESSLLADTPRTMGTIDRLDQIGVRLSLDDFGTGYSSLAYLRRLPVAELKVDQSFVKNLLLDEQDEAIVRSTIDLAHNLGLQVVAEGIENSPVLERLQALGCDIGQGYGISRPLAPNLFATWLATTEYRLARRTVTSLI